MIHLDLQENKQNFILSFDTKLVGVKVNQLSIKNMLSVKDSSMVYTVGDASTE